MQSIKNRWLPTHGNVLFTLLVVALLLVAQTVGALPPQLATPNHATRPPPPSPTRAAWPTPTAILSPATVQHDLSALQPAARAAAPLWEEQWTGSNGVQVSDGLFNVMLGSLTPIPRLTVHRPTPHSSWASPWARWRDVPRVQLGSVPFAVQALTVPDGSITAAKLSPEINLEPPDGSITSVKLAEDSVSDFHLNLSHSEKYLGSNQGISAHILLRANSSQFC